MAAFYHACRVQRAGGIQALSGGHQKVQPQAGSL